tara:strand:+ start:132 stop:374 length:243 start_codon:yes stop_codon:yes gene_type:complete
MAKSKSKTNYGQIFKTSAAVGGGVFAGMIPQMLLGAVIFYIGLNLRKSGNMFIGTILCILGAVLLGSPFGTMQLLQNLVD